MEDIKKKLINLREKCYAPYSNFCVTSICQMNDGTETIGVNIENSSFPVGICAERVSISQAIALGYDKKTIKKIFLYTDSKFKGSPCGMCRQFISEVVDKNTEIEIYNKLGNSYIILVKDLLPFSFDNKDLK